MARATTKSTATEPRLPLTRERALAAAVALADADGIDSLSMRKLARELGVEAMSLYHHVANKSDILDGMVDLVFAEIELPEPDAPWRPAMRARAISARQVLRTHPWAISLMQSRTNPGPSTLRHHDSVLGTLLRAGFSLEEAAHAFSLLDAYIYGFALQEETMPFEGPEDAAAVAAEMFADFPSDEYPYLAEFTIGHIMQPGYDYGAEFEFGLDLILDSLERSVSVR